MFCMALRACCCCNYYLYLHHLQVPNLYLLPTEVCGTPTNLPGFLHPCLSTLSPSRRQGPELSMFIITTTLTVWMNPLRTGTWRTSTWRTSTRRRRTSDHPASCRFRRCPRRPNLDRPVGEGRARRGLGTAAAGRALYMHGGITVLSQVVLRGHAAGASACT